MEASPTVTAKAEALEYLKALYSAAGPGDGSIAILKNPHRIDAMFSVDELSEAAGLIAELNPSYMKVALLDRDKISAGGVGGNAAVKTVVAIQLDVDAEKDGFGTRDEAVSAMRSMPHPPSMIVNTKGEDGGFHAYWILREPLRIDSDHTRNKISSIAKAWENKLREMYGSLDATSDLARMLRPAGTFREGGEPVSIAWHDVDARYDLEDLTLPIDEPVRFDTKIRVSYDDASGSDFMKSPESPRILAGIMDRLGYRVWQTTDGGWRFNRPGSLHSTFNGKIGDCVSASGNYQFISWTPNAPFPVNERITVFQAYADLCHGGDLSRAASALYDEGFGETGECIDASEIGVDKLIANATFVTPAIESPKVTRKVVSDSVEMIPMDLMDDGNWIGGMMNWVMENQTIKLPELAFATSIHLMGLACARVWRDDSTHQTAANMYLLSIAPTGSGKEMPRKCAKIFLEEAGYQHLCGPDKLSSGPGLDWTVAQNKVVGAMPDEVGDLIEQMCSPRAAEYTASISQSLKILYTASSSGHWQGSCRVADEIEGVSYPHLNFWGSTTPAKFFNAMSADKITDGLIGRFTMLYASITKQDVIDAFEKEDSMQFVAPSQRLIDSWLRVKLHESPNNKILATFSAAKNDDETGEQTMDERVLWNVARRSAEAKARFREHDLNIRLKNIDHESEMQDVETSVWSRANEKTAKLALLFAMSRWSMMETKTAPVITIDDMDRAIRLSNFLARRLIKSIKSQVHDSSADADVVELLRVLSRKQKGSEAVNGSWLYRVNPLKKLKAINRDRQLVELLQMQGYIQVTQSNNGGTGFAITDDGIARLEGEI